MTREREGLQDLGRVPRPSQSGSGVFPHVVVVAFGTFQDVLAFADSTHPIIPRPYAEEQLDLPELPQHLCYPFGEASAAIAAGKNVVFTFERPGSGAMMIARRLVSALGPLSHEHALQISGIHAHVGLTTELVRRRPFRAPHHTVTDQGLFGIVGKTRQEFRPGDFHLATRGILFLDEGPEFRRSTIREVFRLQRQRKTTRVVMGWLVTKGTPAPSAEQLAEWNAVEVKITLR